MENTIEYLKSTLDNEMGHDFKYIPVNTPYNYAFTFRCNTCFMYINILKTINNKYLVKYEGIKYDLSLNINVFKQIKDLSCDNVLIDSVLI